MSVQTEKYFHLVAVAKDLEGILGNIVWSVPLEDLRFKGYSALKLHPTPLSVQESGHPTPRRELTLNLTHWAACELLFFMTFIILSIETVSN